jgi:ubiquinone/menaquinone biosynthesis C-methylase UbiE
MPEMNESVTLSQTLREFWEDEAIRDPKFATCGAASLLRKFQVDLSAFEFLGQYHGRRALEVGCGWGRIILPLATKTEAIGLDVSTVMAQLAKTNARSQKLNLDLVVGDAAHLPFREKTMDLLVSLFLFQHLPTVTMEEAISETSRVLKADGGLLAYLPNRFGLDGIGSKVIHDTLGWKSHWGPAKVHYYSMSDLKRIFKSHFQKVQIYAKEFRVPWIVFHNRVLIPYGVLPFLNKLSSLLELVANNANVIPLKMIATGLTIKAEVPR